MTADIPYLNADPVRHMRAQYIPVYAPVPSYAACYGEAELTIRMNTSGGQNTGLGVSEIERNNLMKAQQANLKRDIPVSMFIVRGFVKMSNEQHSESEYDYSPQPDVGNGKTDYQQPTTGSNEFDSRALLEKISEADLKRTDVYVFRENTGELIGELLGDRTPNRIAGGKGIYVDIDKGKPRLTYSMMIHAFDQLGSHQHGKGRESGVQYGEHLQVVMINRKTGYIALRNIQAIPAADGVTIEVDGSDDPALMRPPNLQVDITREFDPFIRADTLHQVEESVIGFEGSGLTSDNRVIIVTDWKDHTGHLLPAKLPTGYVGRITKVVTGPVLAESGAEVHHFEIMPGRRIQVLKTPKFDPQSRQHYYVHVYGDPRNPDFSTDSDRPGILKYLPKFPVPLLVPVADIIQSDTLKRSLIALDKGDEYLPVYRRTYRPEAQFSIHEFDPKNIKPLNPTANPKWGPDIQVVDLTTSPYDLAYLNGSQLLVGPAPDPYDLLSYRMFPIDRFGTPERNFELQVYDQYGSLAASVSIDQLGITTVSDLSALSPNDFVMLSLFQTDDPENVLWSQVLTDIKLISSDDLESREKKSFIVYDPANKYGINGVLQTSGRALLTSAPIKARIVGKIPDEEHANIVWKIQAVSSATPLTYGGIYSVKYGATDARLPLPAVADPRCTRGTDAQLWSSGQQPLISTRTVSFRPCPPSHNPAKYVKGSGTRGIDVHRKNPRLTYTITATITVPGKAPQTLTATAKMDDKDMLRQEYITHTQSAPESIVVGGRGVQRIVKVPTRSSLKALADMPEGDWVDTGTNGYRYQYLLSDGIEKMWADFQTAWNDVYTTPLTISVPPGTTSLPADDGIRVSSSYRNPERQEYYGNATKSLHMMGRALDIAATGVPSLGTSANPTPSFDRGVVFHIVTNAMENNSIAAPYWDMWQLEDIDIATVKNSSGFSNSRIDGADRNNNGILDGYERTGHLHLQDDPTLGNHR
ncbi:MAG: hypothetical protein CO186_02630 [Zetaproteobacteria bacterium CG_4_9_14_3_um_filter_49_83]|nr:MAG: hypothetical protein COS35_08585 [Zetaproteobacteria bacterium CG02_land_8_20_14_3_00_50_9]PJA36055.1 MAG: hypothetical protein CO186_02630 [Zetaproteobacteria bacterium CG_4_9_14_3_um_filter_49_83]